MADLVLTGPNGVKVAQNACVISTGIDDDDVTVTLDDPNIFAQNSYVIMEEECCKVTDADTNPRVITRAQVDHNGDATSADDHTAGVYVRERTGTTLMEYIFDGSTYFAGISVTGERAFWAAIEKDGVQGEMKIADSKYPTVDFIRPRYIPTAATWKVLIWTTEIRQFHGSIYN